MLRLITFGKLALLRNSIPVGGSISSPQRLLLLALIASAGPSGLSYDTLVALVWPDSEDKKGRSSLHTALSSIRKTPGFEHVLITGSDSIRLDRQHLSCDLWDFRDALKAEHLERAFELYTGAFADGVKDGGSEQLQHRLDVDRTECRRLFLDAVERLARAAEARGDRGARVQWWERYVAADRLSMVAAEALINALTATGEAARALKFALAHQKLLRSELDIDPSPAIRDWISRLRDPAYIRQADGALADTAPHARIPSSDGAETKDDLRTRRMSLVARALAGRYRVDRLMQEGASIATFLAYSQKDGARPLELHVTQAATAAGVRNARFNTIFDRVCRLSHRNLLPTLEFGSVGELHFFVTALRPGKSLKERLAASDALPIEEAITVALDLLRAIIHVHEHGIVHGDLRPKHVALAPDCAVIGGVGVAQAVMARDLEATSSSMATFGSPTYMSPEQLSGGVQFDESSDIYAVGSILYEMLAGEPPFGRKGSRTIARKISQPAPSLREVRDTVPESLARVVARFLARLAADRYQSAQDAMRDLAKVDRSLR